MAKYDCPFVDNEMPYGKEFPKDIGYCELFLFLRKSEGQKIPEKETVKQKLTALFE